MGLFGRPRTAAVTGLADALSASVVRKTQQTRFFSGLIEYLPLPMQAVKAG